MQENSHCGRHPAESAVGICSICLKEKLGKLAVCDKQPFPESSSHFTKRNVGRIDKDKDRSNQRGHSDGFVLFSRSKSVASSSSSSAMGSLEDPKTSSKKKASFWSFLRKKNSVSNEDVNFVHLGPKVTRSRSVGYVGSRNQHRPIGFSDSAPRAFDPHQKTKMKGDEEEEEEVKTTVKCGRLFLGFGGVPSSSAYESARICGSHRRTRMGIFY